MRRADFRGVDLSYSNFEGVDLSEARGSPAPCPTTSCVWRSLPLPYLTSPRRCSTAPTSRTRASRAPPPAALPSWAQAWWGACPAFARRRPSLGRLILGVISAASRAQVGADLSGADLRSAKLAGARLQEARLSRARLDNANLSFADLRRVSFDFVDEAANATFDGASMEGAVFKKCVISGARGPVWGGG